MTNSDGDDGDDMAYREGSREQGVDFAELDDCLASREFPLTTDEVVDACGDAELEMAEDTRTLSELLEPIREGSDDAGASGIGDEEYGSPEEFREFVLTMVGDEALGREEYSDSRGSAANENEDQSF